jgi:hypothetical protein
MAPQTAIIIFAGWLIVAIALATLPRERSIRWKITAILALLLAFSVARLQNSTIWGRALKPTSVIARSSILCATPVCCADVLQGLRAGLMAVRHSGAPGDQSERV